MYHKVLPFVLAMCLTGATLSAQEPEEGVEIEVLDETQTTEPIIRTPQSIPITCFYYPAFEMVELSFLSDLGTADIVVSNLDSTLKCNALKSLGYRTSLEYCKQLFIFDF